MLPEGAPERMKVENFLTEGLLMRAINELPTHAMPGHDGFPAEFFCTFQKELAAVLLDMYQEGLQDPDGMPAEMREAIVSLLYKDKGSREEWNNYRPISVLTAEYKILEKAMQIAIGEQLQYLVSPTQCAFQKEKYIGECTALAQLLAARCDCKDLPGLLMLLDGEKAFDFVQWGSGDDRVEVARSLERLSTAVLGYDQPVAHKAWD